MNWKELMVTDAEGNTARLINSLDVVAKSYPIVRDGALVELVGYLLHAPTEEPEWDTPRVNVDWGGFTEAMKEAQGA